MTSTDRADVERVPPERFAELVATLWRRQGWTVSPSSSDDRLYAATRPDGDGDERRALFAVYRSPGGAVDARAVLDRARVELGSDGTTLVTNAGFAPGAVDAAAAHGVDLVGPDDLARLVDALHARPLLDGITDGSVDADGSNASDSTDHDEAADAADAPDTAGL